MKLNGTEGGPHRAPQSISLKNIEQMKSNIKI